MDMKQTALEREFHKLSLYATKIIFYLCPIPPGFAMTPQILLVSNEQRLLHFMRDTRL